MRAQKLYQNIKTKWLIKNVGLIHISKIMNPESVFTALEMSVVWSTNMRTTTTNLSQPNSITGNFSRIWFDNDSTNQRDYHTTAQLHQDFLLEPEQPMAWGPSQGYYGRFWGVSKIFPGGPWEIMAIKACQWEALCLLSTLEVPYTHQKNYTYQNHV